ncbi:MAG: class C beta-lactamase-related serine hydrolase [Calditrichaeota bacterium]|nr:MAG: class C beta-lactamase-related serine hydrolase [Calditrichota bacterium]
MTKTRIPFYDYLVGTTFILSLLSFAIFISCSKDTTSPEIDNNQLEYVTPEEVGYSSQQLNDAKQFAEQSGYAAVMALYDGKVFFNWGEITKNYKCHSIRKPFLSALYGIHVMQGNISLDATLAELGIDDIPPSLTIEEKQATVRDLLKSRSGVYHEAAAETQEMKELRPERGSHPPGTFFYYNNWDFNALGTIFEQETGTRIFEEFKRRIADPIGMEDFSVSNCYYQYEDSLSMHPAYSFRMSARDMARFGVLYQKNGNWKGTQIIPTDWINESTTTYSILDSTAGVGYGYMWYTIPDGSGFAQMIGASGFYHTGVGVHIVIVLPELKLVLVERYDTDGSWTDPGDAGMELGLMIINARISK